MFDSIGLGYDLLRLRQDLRGQEKLAAALALPKIGPVLDAPCSTGDGALEICRQQGPGVAVTGIDFSPALLASPRTKIRRQPLAAISILAGKVLARPFKYETFRAVNKKLAVEEQPDVFNP